MRPKGTAAELEQRRRLAVSLLEQGMKPAQVAKSVGTSRASVTRWRQAHQKGGAKAVAAKPHPGKPLRLTVAQRRRLAKFLLQGAGKHGYSTDLWTLARVAEVIADNFGVEYHPGHVWYVLRSMHWSSQKPERRARERDEQAIVTWRKEGWPRIKKRPKQQPKHRIPG
jgi:transposase